MSHAMIKDWQVERETLVAKVKSILDLAKERGKDPDDSDLEIVKKSRARIDAIDVQLDQFSNPLEMDEVTADKLRALGREAAPAAHHYRNAGEMLWDVLHATHGNPHDRDDRDAADRWGRVMKRVEHMGTTAEATKATAGGFGDLFVAPTVGAVVNLSPMSQPFLNAIGKRPAPNSINFNRPRLVDPNFTTGAAVQELQKDELASKKFDVKTSPVELVTYGGYLNVSQQLLSLHPEALNIIIDQLQRRVAWQGEAAAIAELAESSNEVSLATGADSDAVVAALYDAAVAVWTATGELPTWIAFGPLGWARLGKVMDDAGRPLFPFLNPSNAIGNGGIDSSGSTVPGLQNILTPGITNADIWVGNSLALEAYAYQFPVLEAVEPSVFGRQVAVAEALAFFRPITTEPTTGNGAVRVGPA